MVFLLDILANLILLLVQFCFSISFNLMSRKVKNSFPAELLSEACELRLSSCFLLCSGTEIWSLPGSQEKHWRIISSGVSAGDSSNEDTDLLQTVKKIRTIILTWQWLMSVLVMEQWSAVCLEAERLVLIGWSVSVI